MKNELVSMKAVSKETAASKIASRLDNLTKRLCTLQERMADQLSPVMGPDYPMNGDECDRIAFPPYFENLTRYMDTIETQIEIMNKNLDRVEI